MFKDQTIIQDLTGGLNSKQRPTKIADNQMISILGFDFDANSLRRAKGYTKFGTESETTLTGKTLYTHNILSGIDIVIKTIGTKLKFYDSVDDAWYTFSNTTWTADLKWSFSTFNSYLYGNNGTDQWVVWQGSAYSHLNGAILAGATTIDLTTNEGGRFPASGTIHIQDDVITYSGRTTDQLTGVSGVAVDHPSGSTVVLNAVATAIDVVKEGKNTIAFYKNRNFYIDGTNPRKIVHSKLADNSSPETDISNFTVLGSGAGDAGFAFAPAEMIAIKKFVNGNNSSILAVFCKDGSVYSFSVTDGASTTTSTFVDIRTMNSYPKNSSMVSVAENDLAMVDQFGYIRTLNYGDTNTPLTVQTISSSIEPSLEATFWEDSAIFYFKRKLWVAGSTIDGGNNDIFYFHDGNYNSWGAYSHWDVIDFEKYNDDMIGLSAVSGDVWKLHDSYSVYLDDVDDNYEASYYSEAVSKEFNFGLPHQQKQVLKLRADGFISSNSDVYLDVYTDGSLLNSFLINGDNTTILGTIPNVACGSIVFGTGVFGGGLPSGTTRKEFYAEILFPDVFNFLKIQFKIRMDGKNIDFELTNLTIFAKLLGIELWTKGEITAS